MSTRRYPAYKPSGVEWLGEVPSHWDIAPYKRLVDIQNGADHKNVEQDEGYPVIGSGGVFAHASEYLYDGEAVLLGRKGTIDKPLHVNGRFWTVDTMYWAKITPGTSGKFAYYEALTIPFSYYSTSTALPSMTKGALGAHLVAQPPSDEQYTIAAFLDRETAKIDALIAEQERLIALLQEKRQAVISQAVTKGLDPTVPMKDSGVEWLGMVPEHWDTYGFLRGFNVVYRYPTYFDISYEQSGIPEIRGEAIGLDGQIVELDDMRFISPKTNSKFPMTQLALNDLVMSVRGTLGKIGLVDEKFVGANITANLLRLSPDPSLVRAEFLVWLMRAELFTIQLDLVSSQTTIKTVTVPQLGQIKIPVPSLQEQKDITTFLKHECQKMEGLKEEANKAITLLRERRAALISAAVTGKIDVRAAGAAAQEAA